MQTGIQDIPASDLPSIADLRLPSSCSTFTVTGRHGFVRVECFPEELAAALEVERRAATGFDMDTALGQLSARVEQFQRAGQSVPQHGPEFRALCQLAGSDAVTLYDRLVSAVERPTHSAKRKFTGEAHVAHALAVLAQAANCRANAQAQQLGLILEPRGKKARVTSALGITPSVPTMGRARKSAELASGYLANSSCKSALQNQEPMAAAVDDYHIFVPQLTGQRLHVAYRVLVARPLPGSAIALQVDGTCNGGIRPGVFPISDGLNRSMTRELREIVDRVVAALQSRLRETKLLLPSRPDVLRRYRGGDKVDFQELRHRQDYYDNIYENVPASSGSLADVQLVGLEEGPLHSMDDYMDIVATTLARTPALAEYLKHYYLPITGDAPTYRTLEALCYHAAAGRSKRMKEMEYCKALVPLPGLLHYRINLAKDLVCLPSYLPFWRRMWRATMEKELSQTPQPWQIYFLEQSVLTAWLEIAEEGTAGRMRQLLIFIITWREEL